MKGNGAIPRLPLLTPMEFDADEPPNSVVEGLVWDGVTHVLAGASKAGKSLFALQLMMAVCSGETFLGLPTALSPVLLVSLELSAGALRRRAEAISAATDLPMPAIGSRFHVAAPTRSHALTLDLTKAAGLAALRGAIEETGARLVGLDTLYRFLPGLDPSSNADMGKAFGDLNELAQATGAGLLLLDHTSKGENLGPTSHAAIGAQVKGGASAAVISLRRTSREDGGRWQVDVDSWFGSWDEPLYYERPKLHDGTRGAGCVRCTASEAFGLPLERVRALFADRGERDEKGRAFFPSKARLIEALTAEKLASGNADGAEVIKAIQRDYSAPAGARVVYGKPIATSDGPRNATVFTWRVSLEPMPQEEAAP